MTEPNPNPTDPPGWFDRKENVRKVLFGLFGACGLLVLIDVVFWITGFDKHPYLKWEQWPGFQAIYGFVACVLLVLVAKYVLRPLVMRAEDYYEEGKNGGEDA
ncbi:MAG: hypothetical protein AAGA96_05205 [Verrucomicrobiota bacterium]